MTPMIPGITHSAWQANHEIVITASEQTPWGGTAKRGPQLILVDEQTLAARFAPHRWLVLNKGETPIPDLAKTSQPVDVGGKWTCLELVERYWNLLSQSGGHIRATLDADSCMALPLFDCPALLISNPENTRLVCLQTSYLDHWISTMEYLGARHVE